MNNNTSSVTPSGKRRMAPVRVLGVFSLAMITAGSVDSVRNLPATALFGSSLIFFFLLGALLFLLPCALVSAELSSTSQDEGGVYAWVKAAFGQRCALIAVWFQWIENVIWYPTILSFVAGTVGYLISPTLATNPDFLIAVILTCFWGVTLINLTGIRSSARFSNFCAVSGLLIPMALIMGLGVVWLTTGHISQIHFDHQSLLPNWHSSGLWVSLTGIILSFGGMEIACVHASDVKTPQRAYPRAMLLASLIIVVTLLWGALTIAMVVPNQQISLVAGIMQAFHEFFKAYHLTLILPVVAAMLVIGGLGGVNNWIIAPTRGLLLAAKDGSIPQHFSQQNRWQAPSRLLIYQAVIVSVIALIFLLMPSVNGSYWLLTALSAQLYMIMYVIMFAAAIRLRFKRTVKRRPGFMIPGGVWGMVVVAGLGILGSLLTLGIGFIPPDNINIGAHWHYVALLALGLCVLSVPPFLFYLNHKQRVVLQDMPETGEPTAISAGPDTMGA